MALPKEKIRANALKHLEKGRLDKAVKEFERLVNLDPNDMRTMLKLGDLHERMGNIDDAVEIYESVATFYDAQGFLLKACAIHKQIMKMAPQHVQTALTLADTYQQLGLSRDASREYRRVCQILLRDEKHQKRAEVLEKIVKIDPLDVGNQIQFANALSHIGYEPRAIKVLREACEFHQKQDNLSGFIELMERLIGFTGGDLETRIQLAQACIKNNEIEKALANLETCREIESNNRHVLAMLAKSFILMHEPTRALEVLWDLFKHLKAVGDMASEKNILEQILNLDPSNPEAQEELAKRSHTGVNPAMIDPQKPQMSALEKIIQECDVYARYKRLDKALEHLDDALILSPNNRDVLSRKRDWLFQAGKTSDALNTLWTMASTAHQTGQREEALTDLQELLHHAPEHIDGNALLENYGPLAHYEPTLESPAISLPPDFSQPFGHELGYSPSPQAASIDLDDLDEGTPQPPPPPSTHDGFQTLDEINISEPSEWLLQSVEEDDEASAAFDASESDYEIDLDFDIDGEEDEPTELGFGLVLAPPPPVTQPAITPPVLAPTPTGTASMPPPPVVAAAGLNHTIATPPPFVATDDLDHTMTAPPPVTTVDHGDYPPLQSEMDEIRFFLQHDLPDEALDVLRTLLGKYPNHPGLLHLASSHPLLEQLSTKTGEAAEAQGDKPEIDETEMMLEELLSPTGVAALDPLQTSELPPLLQASEFKSLRQHLPSELADTDYDTHYNLGIAYKEMGMLDDATRELTLAAESPAYRISALTMLGQCKMQGDKAAEALATYFKALHSENIHGDEQISLHYEIATAYLKMGVKTEAQSYFEKVSGTAPGYRDVDAQLKALKKA
ncbi:MAG: tetratricopeptide repeat protein, partial [Deltaproteobacteria bacterium]|nr:tetratricopeptide repeat protein [Deltaproteobacteria bacterium]